jgi:septum site-determining protein MinD
MLNQLLNNGGKLARVIGIVSGKGGVGKTTVTANLGAVLAQSFGKRVTVVDCNVTASHLGLYLGMYYSPATLNKLLRGEVTVEEAIHQHFSGMKLVPASLSLTELEGMDIMQLREIVKPISEKNDIVLLDSAPGLGRESLAVLRASEEVIYVTTPFLPSVLDIVRSQEVVKELGVKQIGVVLNMVGRGRHEMTRTEIEQLTGMPIIAAIPYDKNVDKSLANKMPVVNLNPHSGASKEFVKLGAILSGVPYKNRSLVSKILGKLRLRKKSPETNMALTY